MRSLIVGSLFVLGSAVALVLVNGCGGGSDASGLLRVDNGTSSSRLSGRASTPTAPGYLGMKITAIYLGSTVTDGHVPSEATLWFHPDCLVPAGEGDGSKTQDGTQEAHIARCGIEKGGTASNTEHSTVDHQVRTYIDLARPTSEVNAQLAAQALTIRPGTYSYVGIAMSDPGNTGEGEQQDEDGVQTLGQVPSVKFWAGPMGGALDSNNKPPLGSSVRYKATQMWYSAITPVTVAAGDQLEFTLHYDLSQAYWNGNSCTDYPSGVTGGYCHTTQINGINHFIKLPEMTVTVQKVTP